MSSHSSSPLNAASAGRGLSPPRAAQSGSDYLAEAATAVSTVDWYTDGREVRPSTRQQRQAPARSTTQVQMEARPRASTPFALDRPSKPARLDKADTLRIDEEIAICQTKTPQPISIRREHNQLPKLTRDIIIPLHHPNFSLIVLRLIFIAGSLRKKAIGECIIHKLCSVLTRTKCMFRPARKYPPTLPLFFSDDYNI